MSQPPRILIVDDDALSRSALSELLQGDCEVLLAKDGHQALAQASKNVALVLLDVSLPDISGYQVLQRMKEDPQLAQLPVIFVTGKDRVEDEERGLLLGAVDYIHKPFSPALVRARINIHLALVRQRRQLEQLALQDGLLNIPNRRHFDKEVEKRWQYLCRHGGTLSMVLFDVDFFKPYNDHYGHPAGDRVLQQIAALLAATCRRPGDLIARYGGEEFIALLPTTEAPAGMLLANQISANLRANAIAHEVAPAKIVTLSSGGVTCRFEPNSKEPHYRDLVVRADEMLYLAKAEGRDAMRWWTPDNMVAAG